MNSEKQNYLTLFFSLFLSSDAAKHVLINNFAFFAEKSI